jgi:murein DD-endopeptidase MepM/ murein hydrolase activator NlpD
MAMTYDEFLRQKQLEMASYAPGVQQPPAVDPHRSASYEEWQLQQYGNIAPKTAQSLYGPTGAPPQGAPPPLPPEVAPPTNYVPGSTYVPQNPQPAPAQPIPVQRQPGAAPVYVEPARAPGSGVNPNAQPVYREPTGPTPIQARAASEALRTQDMRAGTGIYRQTTVGAGPVQIPVGSLDTASVRPDLGVSERNLYEATLQRRAQEQFARRAAEDDTPLVDQGVMGQIGDSGLAAALGKTPLANADDVLGAAVAGLRETGLGGALEAGATKALEVAQIPQQTSLATLTRRAYDRLKYGDADRTFGPFDPANLMAGLEGAAFGAIGQAGQDYPSFLTDPANADLIVQIFEQGYKGLAEEAAVEAYYADALEGIGLPVLHGIASDPLAYGEAALSGGAALGAKGALGIGRAVGKRAGRELAGEAAGQAVATGIRRTADVVDAVLFDPLRIPGAAARRTVGPAAGALYERVGLSRAGQNQRALNALQDGVFQIDAAGRQVSPDPWLFERNAAGAVLTDPATGRPLVRDRRTGAIRPIAATDIDDALEIMARLPHERALRQGSPAQRTSYQRMLDDWMHVVARHRRLGLPRMLETTFPSRGAEYRKWAQMTARRVQRFGQEAIDAHYEGILADFENGLRRFDALSRLPAARRGPAHAQQLRSARHRVLRAAHQADLMEAAMVIAGRADAKASLRRADIARLRAEAIRLGGYAAGDRRAALYAAGARAATGTPARLTYADLVDTAVLPDEVRAVADQALADGRSVGDLVMQVRADLDRIRDLSDQIAERAAAGQPLSPWDVEELRALTQRYFPDEAGAAADLAALANHLRDLTPEQYTARLGDDVRRTVGIDRGLLDAQGNPIRTGVAAQQNLLGAAVRGLDAVAAGYSKVQLYNPLNIVRYSGLQAIGNAVTLAVGDAGALQDYAKAIVARVRNRGRAAAATPFDQLTRDAGLGPSPFVKQVGVKDDIPPQAFAGSGADRFFRAARRFAGAFDTSLREAAYMHRFQPRYRALQLGLRRDAAGRAREMGAAVTPAQIDAALQRLDALHPYRAYSPAELKQALLVASGTPNDAAVARWADRVARDFANGTRLLHKDALANVKRLGFSFEETNLDKVASRVFLYWYWSSRANMLYTRELFGNPALLNAYVNLWKAVEADAEKRDRPDWLRGMAQFAQTPLGLVVFTNPAATFNAFAVFNPEILGGQFDANLTPLGRAFQRSPFMVNPVLHLLAFASGALGSGAQAPSLVPISFGATYDLLAWWNQHAEAPFWTDDAGNPVPPPIPLRDLGGKEIAQIVAERLSPITAPILSSLGIPADVMQHGDFAASQNQDIRYLAYDVLREQHPDLSEPDLQAMLADVVFDPGHPVMQEAMDRYAGRLTAGAPTDQPLAAWLTKQASPFPILPRVATRDRTEAALGGWFDRERDMGTWREIAEGYLEEPVRVGGYSVPPPSLFTTVALGGTVVTPEQLVAMSPVQRLAVANEWFEARHGRGPVSEENPDPFPEDASALSHLAKAADPADLKLQRAADASWNPGTPEQNAAKAIADQIGDGTITEPVTILDTAYSADGSAPNTYALADLTDAERRVLARAWLIENGLLEAHQGYYDALDALEAENPDLGGLRQMKTVAAGYPGGPVAWVRAAIKENPDTYGQYAARLDPARYPPGSADWVKEMLSLEAYQALHQQRPSSTSPVAWESAPGAPVIPGLTGGASLAEVYVAEKAAREAEFAKQGGGAIQASLDRLGQVLLVADAYDAQQGYPAGTSRGIIMQQLVTGDTTTYRTDKALYDYLNDALSGTTEDGVAYGPLPGKDSYARKYIVWALRQPEAERSIDAFLTYSDLEEFAQMRADGAVVVADPQTGRTTLAMPEVAGVDPLAGLSLQRSADGSGVFLTTSAPEPASTPVPPPRTTAVGPIGGTLYSAPDGASQPLTTLAAGTELTVIEEAGRYLRVRDPYGLSGYVAKAMLTKPGAAPPPTPAPAPAPAPVAPVTMSSPATTPTPTPQAPPVTIGGNRPAPQAQPGPLQGIASAVGGFFGGIGSAITSALGHNGQGSTTPPTKPAETSKAAPTLTATPSPTPAAGTTPSPTTTPFYDVVPARDGIGVQSTIASDRTWMEFMLDNHAVVTVDYKADAPAIADYSYQLNHGADATVHAGYDISCDDGNCAGRPIKSPVSGVVVCAGYGQGTGGSVAGCTYSQNTTSPNADGSLPAHTVVVEVGRDAAGNPVQLSFNHMGTSALRPGQTIDVGDVLGTMGNTPGGPHVHLEGWVGDAATGWQIVDPQLVVGGYFTGGTQPATTPTPAAVPGKVAPRTAPGLTPGDPAPYQPLVQQAATRHGVPAGILSALLKQESQYDPAALSPAGALGLAQFMPETAAGMGIDPLDPAQAIDGAARYLAQQYAAFGSWELALAAYNAGPGNVQQYGGIPPFPETQHYVATIMANAG